MTGEDFVPLIGGCRRCGWRLTRTPGYFARHLAFHLDRVRIRGASGSDTLRAPDLSRSGYVGAEVDQ